MVDIYTLLKMPVVEAGDIAGLVSYVIKPEAKFITGKKAYYNSFRFVADGSYTQAKP
jgi:hypothetical protein